MSEFFDKISGFASAFSKKTGEVVDAQKLKAQKRSLEKGNKQDYEDLGRMVYEKYTNGETVSAEASALCDTIRERLGEMDQIDDDLAVLKETGKETTDAMRSNAKEAAGTAGEGAKKAFDKIKEKVAPAVDSLKEKAAPAVDSAKEKIDPVVDSAKEKAGPAFDKAKEKVGPAVEKAKEKIGPAVDTAKEKIDPYVDKAKEKIDPYVDKAKEKIDPYVDSAKEKLDQYVDKAKEKATPVIASIKEKIFKKADAPEEAPAEAPAEVPEAPEAPANRCSRSRSICFISFCFLLSLTQARACIRRKKFHLQHFIIFCSCVFDIFSKILYSSVLYTAFLPSSIDFILPSHFSMISFWIFSLKLLNQYQLRIESNILMILNDM